jgi:VanZ family protein
MTSLKRTVLTTKKYINLWLPVAVWAIVIFTFSNYPTTPASQIHWQDFVVKKSAHVVEYAILTTLLYRAFLGSGMGKLKAGYLSILLALIYAISDEFHQSFVPGRDATLRDVVIDFFGSVASIYFIWNYLPKMPSKFRKLAKNLELI